MGFGDDYHGMSDREILIEVAVKQKIMEVKLDAIQCPSPRCQLHERRIGDLENVADDYTQRKTGFWNKTNIFLTLFIAAIAVAVSIIALVV